MSWEPIMRMDSERRGVIVSITDGKTISLVGRVRFARWRTKRPLRSFKRALRIVWDRAEIDADRANGVQFAELKRSGEFRSLKTER